LHLRSGLGRQQPDLEAFQTKVLEKPTALSRTSADAGQGFEHGDGFIARLGRVFPPVCFQGLTMGMQRALGAVKRPLFQGLYPPRFDTVSSKHVRYYR
jgi:hypothetical protein